MTLIKYWYRDNWTGKKRCFPTLREAKKSAKEETGIVIHIYKMDGNFKCTVEASGHIPA